MDNPIFLIIIGSGLFFSSCKKDSSQLNKPCSDSCTTISGKFTTGNNDPISNFSVEVAADENTLLGVYTREIASGKTNTEGYYSFTFGLSNDEYGPRSLFVFYFQLKYDSSQFLALPVYQGGGNKEYLGTFLKKDTSLIANVHLITKQQIQVKLENFFPIQSDDFFKVVSTCNGGLNDQESIGYSFNALQSVTEGELYACGNEQTKLYITKKKNGLITSTDTTINTPVGQFIKVSFAY